MLSYFPEMPRLARLFVRTGLSREKRNGHPDLR